MQKKEQKTALVVLICRYLPRDYIYKYYDQCNEHGNVDFFKDEYSQSIS